MLTSLMFKKARFFSFLCLTVLSIFWVSKTVVLRKSDLKAYRNLQIKAKEVATTRSQSSTQQTRQGVRKDLWVSQEEGKRLQYRIDSESSVLNLIPNAEKFDIVENLRGIQCWMQDKLYVANKKNMQQIRFFEAEEGVYRYSSQEFLAKTVSLSFFRLPGSTLPLTSNPTAAFLKGVAEGVSFSISGKDPQFHAQRFKATLQSQTAEVAP